MVLVALAVPLTGAVLLVVLVIYALVLRRLPWLNHAVG